MRNLDAENAAVARLEQIGFARTDAGGFVLMGNDVYHPRSASVERKASGRGRAP